MKKEIDEILNRKVKKFGKSGHIPIPKKYVGRNVKVVAFKEDEKEVQEK